MAEPQGAPYLFISYASADRERVLPLVDALERAGVRIWIDREGIHGGANYGREIAEAIKGSAALVLMASSMSLASRNVKQEIAVAWEYERAYLPLLLEPVTIPDDVKYWLTAAQWIEVLDRPEGDWLPALLAALKPVGISPVLSTREEIRLTGREREMGLLREKLAAATEGKGGLVLIGGEAGIGKTTLAEAAMAEAMQRGCVVLEGHCFDLAETPPYGAWIDLFAHLPAVASIPPLPEAFADRGTVGAVASQMALFVQVEDFLIALAAQRPVVMLLDDLHWSDPASLDLLRFLARSVATRALLILVTYRSDELTRRHPLYPLLPQLAREDSAARVDLGKLDEAAVRTLVEARYGLSDAETARLVAYVQGRAEGNALFVGEMLRTLEESGTLSRDGDAWRLEDLTGTAIPALLRQVIEGRLGRLDEESQRLLAVAAVIGQAVPLAVWAAVGECGEDALLAVVEEALAARVLVEAPGGDGVRFTHALIRETLYQNLPGIRQRRIHRRVGEVFAAGANPDPDTVAFHFHQAGDERALPWLLAAGERAEAAYAFVTGVARYEAAHALMERQGADAAARGWLLTRAARMLSYADVPKARALAGEAVALGEAAGNAALVALARFRGGSLAGRSGDVASGSAEMVAGAEALARLTAAERADLAAHAVAGGNVSGLPDFWGIVATERAIVGRYREARDLGERLLAEAAGDEGALWGSRNVMYGLGIAYAALGMPDEAAAMLARAHEAFLRGGDHATVYPLSRYEVLMVALPYRTEEIAVRRRLAERVDEEWTRVTGALPTSVPQRATRLPLLVLEGEWDEAERVATAMGTMEQATFAFRSSAHRHLAMLAQLRGEAERSWRSVRALLPAGSATEPGTVQYFEYLQPTQRVAAALALDAGDLPTARGWLEAQGRWLDWSGAVLGLSEAAAQWAQYHRQAGDREQAYAHAERALAHASEPRQPLALLAAHRLLGELDTEAGRYDDATRHLNASLSFATACEAPYERALTLLALAELRVATGATDAARTLMDQVRAICEPLGARPALARVDALAARLVRG